jgi:3-hydroxyacyl-[acyl-carrier-protein] dehydratase
MILKDNLFTVESQNITGGKAAFRVKLNRKNFIYEAHFPKNPITPGVCLIQMAVELFGIVKGATCSIKTLKNVKFTAPISPIAFPEVDFLLDFSENENQWQLKTVVKEQETIFAKMSLILSLNDLNSFHE